LGLAYNLLTAYTSFVAIDAQVRLQDGQAVTVKQPLPLPQGVSEYAVGKGEAVQKTALSPSAPRSDSLAGLNGAVKESRTEEKPKAVEKDSEDRKGRIELGEISVSNEQFKRILHEKLRFQISALELCHEKPSEKQTNLKGEVILRVVIDPTGKVMNVDLISSHLKDTHFEQCLIQKITEMKLSMPAGKKQAAATATITLKLN
jgi:Ca-activated chloride channel homolog